MIPRGVRRWALLLALPLVLGCKRGPEATYEELVAAAREGNLERFAQGFTEESRGLVKGLIELTTATGNERRNPLTVLGEGNVARSEDVACPKEAPSRECRALTIQQGSRYRKLLFVKTDDGWRIDLRALEALWKDKRNQSF